MNLYTTTFLTILLGGKVIEGIGRALLIEEDHIFINFLDDRLITGHVQISENLSLNPAINRIHGSVIRRRAGAGHGAGDAIHRQ